ncbi:MAG: hypothetical protein WDW36_008467 [Sanguina aurantia]
MRPPDALAHSEAGQTPATNSIASALAHSSTPTSASHSSASHSHISPPDAAHTNMSPLSVVCGYWKEFDLEGMRASLDEVGLKVAEHQEDAMAARKRLAESTREFKRTPEAATRGVGPLLKQYQEEVDRLTRRAKHGESAFLQLYQKLYEAPDPAPCLSLAAETASRAAELEAGMRKMATELSEYRTESSAIKNQDVTIRKLEERIRGLEAALEDRDAEMVGARERAVADADAARLAVMAEREVHLSVMLAEAQSSQAALHKLHAVTQSQLFEIQNQTEEQRYGRQSELENTAAELERSQERLAALEHEKARLVMQLHQRPPAAASTSPSTASPNAHSNGGGGSGGIPSVESCLRADLSTAREVCAKLRSEVAGLRRELGECGSMWEGRVEGVRASLRATEGHAVALEEELAVRPTNAQMNELRSQLRILQAIGYNMLDADGNLGREEAHSSSLVGGGGSSSVGTEGHAGHRDGGFGAASLEVLLLGKNRHLEHELTMTKLAVVDLRQDLDSSTSRVAELEAQVQHRQALVDRLEEDLMASRAEPPAASAAAARAQQDSGALLLGGSLAGGSCAADDADAPDNSMVRVLCSQRDRFRAKAQEMEEDLTRCRGELAAAKSEAAAARADNMALVERLRYVHGFKQQGGRGRGGEGDVEIGVAVERRYGALYDDVTNPFKEFQGQQKDKQRKTMNVPDKVMYMFGQLVFSSQSARLFTFLYLAAMHLLVFTSLVRMTHHSSHSIYQHQQALLDNRHSATATMHHGGDGVALVADAAHAGAKAVAGAVAGALAQRQAQLP